jgi:hypothetical protein
MSGGVFESLPWHPNCLTQRLAPTVSQVDGCWVTSPAQGSPKGIVHFLGGAFAGASPELVYPLLLQMVGDAGYTVISTPYPVTFKHVECADMVHKVRKGASCYAA